jgi:choline dehydrogenase-like flavoprotein
VPDAVGGFRLNAHVQEIGLTGPIAYGTRLIGGFGARFKAALRDGFGSAVAVGAIGAVIPDARSFVTLDAARDANDVPLPLIHSVLTDNSLALLQAMAQKARALLAETGAVLAEEGGAWDQFGATHVFGTARMGHDSATSVVNAFGRSHDHPNLWIADASVFPSTGGGEAPSLTIEALAMRTADAVAG